MDIMTSHYIRCSRYKLTFQARSANYVGSEPFNFNTLVHICRFLGQKYTVVRQICKNLWIALISLQLPSHSELKLHVIMSTLVL